MRTTPLVLTAALLATAAANAPAHAAPRKPITKTYTANAPTPDPTNYLPTAKHSVCEQTVPQSFHVEPFKAPAPGKLAVKLTGFTGDWDLLIVDAAKGSELGSGSASDVGTPATAATEAATVKVKKAGTTYNIIACNWAGGPTGTVTYTFTYA
jgi:hypothetical protein